LKRYNDWKIFTKIVSLSLVSVLPFILLVFSYILPSLEEQMYLDKKNKLKHTVEVVYSLVEGQAMLASDNMLTDFEAKEKVKEIVQSLRYIDKNYFWINDTKPRMIMHPFQPELNGQSLTESKDPNGIFMFIEMAKVAKKEGQGFVDYMWPKPGYDKPVSKISYVKLFEKWDWVIGTGIYVNDIEEELSAFTSKVIMFLIVAILLAIFAGYIIALKISEPIKLLSEAAEKVTNGELDIQVTVNSDDETGKLSKAFNTMVTNIKTSMDGLNKKSIEAQLASKEILAAKEEVEKYQTHLEELVSQRTEKLSNANMNLSMEVKKRKEAEAEVITALVKEKQVSELKTRFISTVSHEIRTPLTSIMSSAEILQRYGKSFDIQQKEEQLSRIVNSVDYLISLLEDVLMISRTDSGKIIFSPEEVDLDELFKCTVTKIEAADDKKHLFNYIYNSKKTNIITDSKLLGITVTNLINNAVKYSPEKSKIQINVSLNKLLTIEVIDEGIGIPDEGKELLFEPFYRAGNAEKYKGSGLGLSIVKRSVELLNGTIAVESKKDEGSRFIVKIPID
jgi:signal transduction histidine kinase